MHHTHMHLAFRKRNTYTRIVQLVQQLVRKNTKKYTYSHSLKFCYLCTGEKIEDSPIAICLSAALSMVMRCEGLVTAGSVGVKICTMAFTHCCTSPIRLTRPSVKAQKNSTSSPHTKTFQNNQLKKFHTGEAQRYPNL